MSHTGPTEPGDEGADPGLASLIDALTGRLAPSDTPASPEAMVGLARIAMPHAEHVGLSLLRPGRPFTTMSATDDVPREVDRLQYRLGQGPCVDAATSARIVRSGDVATDPRWPEFGPRCTSTSGIRSMLAIRLPLGGSEHAALNAYSHMPDAFQTEDVALASLIAPYVALTVQTRLHEQDVENLRTALDTSRTIATAVGILMTSHRTDSGTAFETLRRASMDLNLKLREVADEVQHTGTLPDTPSRPTRRP